MHGSLIVGIEHRLNQIEDKLSDVDARASEEADSYDTVGRVIPFNIKGFLLHRDFL